MRQPTIIGMSLSIVLSLFFYFLVMPFAIGANTEEKLSIYALYFSMISTVWLIVTVIGQSFELRMQREELQLQRFELSRQADEFKLQNKYNKEQNLYNNINIEFAIKKEIEESIFNYLSTEYLTISSVEGDAQAVASNFLREFIGESIGPSDFSIRIMDRNYFITLNDEAKSRLSKKYPSIMSNKFIKITGSYIGKVAEIYRDFVINSMFDSAKSRGIGKWFTNVLPYTMRPIEGVSRDLIATLIKSNVA